MALPTLVAPEYEVTLLSQSKSVKFRPYLVREEKILLMAQQGGDKKEIENAVKSIIRNCTFGKVDPDKLPSFDLEYLYVQLRSKSVNNLIETRFECQNIVRPDANKEATGDDGRCHAVVPISINLDEIQLTKRENHNKQIQITPDVGLTLRYPTADVLGLLSAEGVTPLTILRVLEECIENVYTADGSVYEFYDQSEDERQTFIDSLTVTQLERIQQFFDTMPVLSHTTTFKCPKCGYTEEITLQGLESFFG
jgi:hypothetical protein